MPTAEEITVNKTKCLPSGAYILEGGDKKRVNKKMSYHIVMPSTEKIKHDEIGNERSVKSYFRSRRLFRT